MLAKLVLDWGIQYMNSFSIHQHFDSLVQDCNISSALTMEIWQSCIKPSINVMSIGSISSATAITGMSQEHHWISNHWQLDCLFKGVFSSGQHQGKYQSSTLLWGESTSELVDTPHKLPVIWKTFLSWHHATHNYIPHVLSQGLSTRNRCSYKVYGHVLNISWLVFFTARLAEHCWWIGWGCWEFLLSHWDLSMLDTGKTQNSEIKTLSNSGNDICLYSCYLHEIMKTIVNRVITICYSFLNNLWNILLDVFNFFFLFLSWECDDIFVQ